jgi:hypothetical protein
VISDGFAAALSIATALGAVVVWGIELVRSLNAYRTGKEERCHAWLIMPLAAFVTALGMSASALAFSASRGFNLSLDPVALSLIASMGRGALFVSGLIILTHYRPGGEHK